MAVYPHSEQNCFAVTDYRNYTITEYGKVNGTQNMVRGAVVCR